MIDFTQLKDIYIVGGGTTGWFAALQMRYLFNDNVNITVISDPDIPIIGVGEGGILNLTEALFRFDIPLFEFLKETGAVHKLGFVYEGWRTNQRDDRFYHMFPKLNNDNLEEIKGYFPLFSVLVNYGIPVSYFVDSINLREKKLSQDEMTALFLNQQDHNFLSSFHFDTYKVGKFLRKIALQRNIKHIVGHVNDLALNAETGFAEHIYCDDQKLKCDFVIDASGFSRKIVERLNGGWKTLNDRLIMNRAIPFHLELDGNPDLVTRSIAMKSGWLWQIPVEGRIGAGYVFNDQFLDESAAIDEVEQKLGCKINPTKLIKFEAGYYQRIWNKNVLTIGLASGFVEPLEATSIGQMLMQLKLFEILVQENAGHITSYQIDYYNQQNQKSWEGIGDFIRMHYDTERQDTDFWKSMPSVAMSDHYKELKEVWKFRTPRTLDFLPYEMHNMTHFGTYSWLAIGQAVGIIRPEVTVPELLALTPETRQKLAIEVKKIQDKFR